VDTPRSVKNIESEAVVTAKIRYIRLKALGLKLFLLFNLLHEMRSTKIEVVLTNQTAAPEDKTQN
jgi:hypothetical protein